ncbi:MAG: ABC transporter permease, partial [Actinomycetota bacterium]|nr:ABC transporter permease [Actinomycetota bacterium]
LGVFFLASIVIFGLVALGPDPLAELRQNPSIRGEDLERIADRYGLNDPLYVQYGIWMGDLLQGDFGESFKQNAPVTSIIAPRVWPTVLLMGASLIFTVIIAIPLGIYSAIKKYSALDNAGTFLSFLGYSMPSFWLGLILQLVLGIYLADWAGRRFFYVSGMSTTGGLVDLLQHLTLPVITLSVISIAEFSRFQRGAMLEVLTADYLRTARAKGLSQRTVYLKHALRNALVPTVTLVALSMGTAFGGAVITETVFAWPGLGFLLADAIFKGDYNVVRALLMISAALIIFFNLVADIAYSLVDPRVSY